MPVEIIFKDKTNDLALLRITDTTKLLSSCYDLPFQLSSAQATSLGQHVSTIEYPLTSMLGSNPKLEGVIASKSDIQDGPR
ncbi:MAG TPA: hypothetical protein VH351_15190 [Bryobacteraceae bacterium]|nr:hypothetical protein [Bryobacteraceae bacterium]